MSYYHDYQIFTAPQTKQSPNYYSVNPTLSYYPMTNQKPYNQKTYLSNIPKFDSFTPQNSNSYGMLPLKTKKLDYQFIELKEKLNTLVIGRNDQLDQFQNIIDELDSTINEIEQCRQKLIIQEGIVYLNCHSLDYNLQSIFNRITDQTYIYAKSLQTNFREIFDYEFKLCELNLFLLEEFNSNKINYEQFCSFFKGLRKQQSEEELSDQTYSLALRLISMKIQLYSNLEYHRQNLQEKGFQLDRIFNYLDKDYDGKLGQHDLKQFEFISNQRPKITMQEFFQFFKPKSQANFLQIHE